MKQLKCEMCGSADIMKQDGVFVCQNCGTKYSVEEAKKMMIEGTVDVQGTVKIDDSSKIDNYYTMAENAFEANNKKEAENYCNKIIEIEPNNYRAWLLKGRAAGWQSTIANIRIEESVNCFYKATDNAPKDKVDEVKKNAANEISKLSLALINLCCDNYAKNGSVSNANTIKKTVQAVKYYSLLLLKKCEVKSADLSSSIASKINGSVCAAINNNITKNYWGSTGHPSYTAWQRYKEQCWAAIDLYDLALNLINGNGSLAETIYKNKISTLHAIESSSSYSYTNGSWHKDLYAGQGQERERIIGIIMYCHNKIREINSDYIIPERPKATKSSGCYVATCVYGSYNCPQVWTLRRYRDNTLAKTWHGRAFIHTYYAISPTIVKWFGNTTWFKKLWRGKLDKMVRNLNNDGVSNAPYEDRSW